MRNVYLYSLPLTIVVVVGCSSQPQEQAARSDLERDLTLVSGSTSRAVAAPDRAVASAIELRQIPTQPGIGAPAHKAVRHRKAVGRAGRHLTPKAAEPVRPTTIERPAIADVVVPNPGDQPVAAVPADSRELPPGQTVSVIPVSKGLSPSGEAAADGFAGSGGSGMGGTGGSGMGGGRRARGMVY